MSNNTKVLNKKLLTLHGILSFITIPAFLLIAYELTTLFRQNDEDNSTIFFAVYISLLAYFHVKALLSVGTGTLKGRMASRTAGWLQCLNPFGWYILYLSYHQYQTNEPEPTIPDKYNFLRKEIINSEQSGEIYDELKKLKELLDSQIITREEFDELKKRALSTTTSY